MPLADKRYFTREHIESSRFGTSPELAEQAIHSLELVAELSAAALSYQFKGGSSLLLILDTPRRFSIDVDIASDETRERIEQCLDTIIATRGVFVRWEPRTHKTKPWLPISSYYLYYRSVVSDSGENSIMLDVQLRRSPYKTIMKPARCGELYACEQTVEVPLAASIAGDKLLTMGPNTLGIPLGKGKQAQRLKHVFDVSCLMQTGPDLDVVRASFNACIAHENELQKSAITAEDVMKDTVAFCASVTRHAARPQDPSAIEEGMLRENAEGLPEFADHLFESGYDWRRMQLDMARVAWCVAAVVRTAVDNATFLAVVNQAAPAGKASPEANGMAVEEKAAYFWSHTNAVI